MFKCLSCIVISIVVGGSFYMCIDRICDYKERQITENIKLIESDRTKQIQYNNGFVAGFNMLMKDVGAVK